MYSHGGAGRGRLFLFFRTGVYLFVFLFFRTGVYLFAPHRGLFIHTGDFLYSRGTRRRGLFYLRGARGFIFIFIFPRRV